MTAIKPSVKVALLVFVSYASLLGQTASSPAQPATFHIEGTISSVWDSLLKGVAVPRSKVTFHGEQAIKTLGVDNKDPYIAVPRTEVTFQGERITRTVTVDDNGSYQADLPFGLYKITAHGPMIGPQALKQYIRQIRVESPMSVVLNGTLYKARMTCDAVVGGDTEEQKMEEWKNICGGEDSFPVPSKDGTPFQLCIQYPQRQASDRGYVYNSNKTAEPDVPVFVAYNLFSLEANTVFYDVKNRTIAASGNVVTADGLGETQHADSIRFKIENGEAVPLP
jgi:hypothetical protein